MDDIAIYYSFVWWFVVVVVVVSSYVAGELDRAVVRPSLEPLSIADESCLESCLESRINPNSTKGEN